MAVQFRFFMIPARPDTTAEAELNGFLASVRALTVHHEFVSHGKKAFWSFCVEYFPHDGASGARSAGKAGKNRMDYRDVLPPEDFAVFVKLRDWRKDVATREAIPVYTIFTNEQLAMIARKRVETMDSLMGIEGIGEARAKKYGQSILAIISETSASAGPDGGVDT